MGSSVFILNEFPALGTLFWVEIFQNSEHTYSPLLLVAATARIKKEIHQFESRYSRFDKSSTLSLFNKERVVVYDEDLFRMISVGCEAGVVSDGVFDIFIKEKLEARGYGASEKTPCGALGSDVDEASTVIWKQGALRLLGSKGIDLGGLGKGYLIDKLAKILQEEYGIMYFIINGGGDMYITSKYGESLEIFLEHPTHVGEFIGKVYLKDSAFCASSSFKRSWKYEGKEVNHFIGKQEVWAASYVLGKTTVQADIFATIACLVSLEEPSLKKYAKIFGSEYQIINEKGDVYISDAFKMEELRG
jgi:thiamine biosynthesis lipoprotein ApbE